jgi:NAD/NADP transhydrogenase beta subunit
MSRIKRYCIGLLLTSLLGYLEWGGNQHTLLAQAEWNVITTLLVSPLEAIHPFTIIPMLGQVCLLISLFQQKPTKWLVWIGMISLVFLLGLMLVIGVMSLRWRIVVFTLPFMGTAFFAARYIYNQD